MPDDTPLSQLVLWVPPAIAAAWEHLAPERQAALTQELTTWLTSRLQQPPCLPSRDLRTVNERQTRTLEKLQQLVEDLERKYGRQAEGDTP